MTTRFAALGTDDVDSLQRLLESAPDYTERITGYPPGPSDALSALIGRPEGVAEEDKFGFGLWETGRLIGFADVLRHHPDGHSAYLGLLFVEGSMWRQGVGRELHDRVLAEIRSWTAIERVELAVAAPNASVAEPFWAALGYLPTGQVRPWRYAGVVSSAAIWELWLPRV